MKSRFTRLVTVCLLACVMVVSTESLAQGIGGSKCTKIGNTRTVRGVSYQCVKTGRISTWRKTMIKVKVSPPSLTSGGSDLEPCRLRESRTIKYQPWNVGFPRGDTYGTPMLPTKGRANVQLIAIEFPDALGTAGELSAAESQIAEFNRWFEFTSKGQLSFSWQFPKQWFRMSRAVKEYQFVKGNWSRFHEITTEMIAISDSLVDFSHSDFVFVLFPKSIALGSPDVGWANAQIPSNEGIVRNLFGGGDYFYRNNFELWSFWVHEWGHPMGLAGHAPRSDISIMDNQNGSSVVLNVWDSFLSGWLEADELYCMPMSTRSADVTLIALEKFERGPRGAIVPISPTNGIVIESHRAEGWGSRLGKGVYGVSVYWVDTTTDTNRYAGSSGYTDTDLGDRWADNLVPPGATRKFDLLQVGDSISYRGVRVTFTKTGDYDTVRIDRGS